LVGLPQVGRTRAGNTEGFLRPSKSPSKAPSSKTRAEALVYSEYKTKTSGFFVPQRRNEAGQLVSDK